MRSRLNASRHGLATHVSENPDQHFKIEQLALILSGYTNDPHRLEEARISAECHFDLQRIRDARFEVFQALGNIQVANSDQLHRAASAVEKIARYERRALSKRRTALKAINSERES